MAQLPPSASVTAPLDGVRLHAPSAARNAQVLCDLLREHAPTSGNALEIASGTGQHVVAFAQALPDITWHPTEVDAKRLASIDAYIEDAKLSNVKPAVFLDATRAGWPPQQSSKDLVLLVNLLHLIPRDRAITLINEAVDALNAGGKFILYGPFKRDGVLISAGDMGFDADLRATDPEIGYKNDKDVMQWLTNAGASCVKMIEMPANNLAFVASKR